MRRMTKTHSFSCHRAQCHLGTLVACISLVTVLSVAQAANAEADTRPRFSSLSAVADAELDCLRGGFRTPQGLEIRFGIRRLTRVNGPLHNDRSFDLMETIYTADGLERSYKNTTYADTFNSMTSPLLKEASNQFLLIQNSLDSQLIQSISIVDIYVAKLFTLHSGFSTSRWIAESARDF